MSGLAKVRKLAWLETKLLVRDPLTLVFTFAFPLIMLFVLAGVFGNSTAGRTKVIYRGVGAIDYYVPAYVALVAAAIGLVSLPVHLASYRELGVFRRFRASGIPAWSVLTAEVVVAFGLTLVGAVLVVSSTAAVYANKEPQSLAGVLVVFVLVTVMFATIGILLGAVLPNARSAQALGMILFFVMLLLSGGGPPPEVMSGAMRDIADTLPLTYAVRILQDPWLGFGWQWTSFLAVTGCLVGAFLVAVRLFRWE